MRTLKFPIPIQLKNNSTELLNFPRFSTTCSNNVLPIAPLFSDKNPQRSFIDLLKIISRRRRITSPSLLEIELQHCKAIKAGFISNINVGNGILHLHAKFGSLEFAHNLFDEMLQRDALTWTILLSAYSRSGRHDMSLGLFSEMLTDEVFPNHVTLSCVLKCCINLNDFGKGREVHGWIVRNRIELDVVLWNTIMELYVKFGAFECVKRVFGKMVERDVVSWNIMISAHLQVGDIHRSMELFRMSPFRDVSSWNVVINGLMQNELHMRALQLLYEMVKIGCRLNQFTFSISLVLAGMLVLPELGRQLHAQILRNGFVHDAFIRTSLIDMYNKCGKMEASKVIFSGIHKSTYYDGLMSKAIAWSSMIAGYVQNGRSEDAFELFQRMLQEGANVDKFTLTSIAAACSDTGLLEQGRQVHAFVEKLGHGFDAYLTSAITNMYAKCGSLQDAHKTFDSINCRNVVSWTSIIGSYALHGKSREAIKLYEKMLDVNIIPNAITFVGVLSACSHGGLIEEGRKYFKSMQQDYGIVPCVEHFTCMVDLLGRAGLLDQAKEFIQENNISHYSVVWRALLAACQVHNNIEMAICSSEHLSQLEPNDVGAHVLLSNTFATRRNWVEASRIRSLMQQRGLNKQAGKSWIQLKGELHTFIVGDRLHPQSDEIYSYLEKLLGRLKEMGYSSRTEMLLHDLEEEQGESALNFHSEKLAIAFGIINTPCGSPIRVMKNLRVCVDCHVAIKYISQVTGREIILRDAHRFHCFKDGKCSCGDYW